MLSRSLRTAVTKAIGEFTGHQIDRISDTDDLTEDLGVDSMAAVSLLVVIEDHVGVPLPDGCEGQLVEIRTVGELVERLASIYGVGAEDSNDATL